MCKICGIPQARFSRGATNHMILHPISIFIKVNIFYEVKRQMVKASLLSLGIGATVMPQFLC